MNTMKRFVWLLILSAGLILAVAHLDNATGQEIEASVPNVAEPCVDRSDRFAAGGAELIASETVDGVTHFLIFTYEAAPGSQRYPSALIVSASNDSCETRVWNTDGNFIEYAQFVPAQAAAKFREVEYSMQLESLGRDGFIEAFDLSEIALLPEEEVALERLGLLSEIQGN